MENFVNSLLEKLMSVNDNRKYDFGYPVESLSNGYLETFKTRIDEYINRVKEMQKENNSIELFIDVSKIELLKNQIVKIIEAYLSGKSEDSYNQFSAIISKYRSDIEALSYKYPTNSTFYRMRKSKNTLKNRKDMFHISFGERHLVSSQRYSIAGVPNLYLGNTSYVCWLELDKPNLDDVYISSFNNQEELNILDFAITFELVSVNHKNMDCNKLIAFFTFFPLIYACSFKKQHSDAKFNIEYIIPNMLLQWLSHDEHKEHFHGIRYFSTKMAHKTFDSKGVNIVLPPKENTTSLDKGIYCDKLKKLFHLTNPVHWALLSSLQSSELLIPNDPLIKYENIEQAFDCIDSYKSSVFGSNEKKLEWITKELLTC